MQNSVSHSLQQLIWAAFVGVVSFQLIAPNVWGYMHKQAGLSYETSYYIFTIGYVVLAPLLAFLWLLRNKARVKTCLFPFGNENEINLGCNILLYGIILNTVFQLLVCLSFILFTHLFSYDIFKYIQLFTLFFSLIVLGISTWIASQRVQETPVEMKRAAREKWLEVSAGSLIALLLLLFWGGMYLKKHGLSNYATNSDKADIGFHILEFKEELAKTTVAADENLTIAAALDLRDSLQATKSEGREKKLVPYSRIGKECLLIMGEITGEDMRQLNVILENPGSGLDKAETITSLDTLASAWKGAMKDNHFELKEMLTGTDSISRLPEKDRQTVYQYLLNLEENIKSTAQQSLGIRLRDTQLKLIFMLLGMGFPLLALFIFLRMDAFVVSSELHAAEDEARRREITENEGQTEAMARLKLDLIAKENKQSASSKVSESLWFHIMLVVWLLMPLLKPIENKDIDTETPFKMFTFSHPVERTIYPGSSSHTTYDHSNNPTTNSPQPINIKIDTVTTRPDTAVTEPLGRINVRLKKMQDEVNAMVEEAEKANKKIDEFQKGS